MGAHHRVLHRRQGQDVFGQLADAAAPGEHRLAEGHVVVVNGGKLPDHAADGGRKRLIGRIEARPQGIATGGHHPGMEDRGHGGPGAEGDVRVPDVVVEVAGPAILFDHGHLRHLRHPPEDRVGRFHLAEAPREGQLLGRSDLLAGEDDHQMVQHGLANGPAGGVVDAPGEVDAVDLGADGGVQGTQVDGGHGLPPAQAPISGYPRRRGRQAAGAHASRQRLCLFPPAALS